MRIINTTKETINQIKSLFQELDEYDFIERLANDPQFDCDVNTARVLYELIPETLTANKRTN